MRLIKSVVNRWLRLTPYELRRRQQEERILPTATFETIKLVLAYYLAAKPLPTFVQIGACDGVSGDPAHDFIVQGRLKALLVEPIEDSYAKLRLAYDGVPNVTTVHTAVGHMDGEVTLYRVKVGGKSVDSHWAAQIASFNRAHLVCHGIAEEEIEPVRVPCTSLQSLLTKHSMEKIDLLQVDTEGFDAEIVMMALTLPEPPEAICFENMHLATRATAQLFERLSETGYLWTHDRWDTLAIHESLTKCWSMFGKRSGHRAD
jgi:FkbM family methyltransferase